MLSRDTVRVRLRPRWHGGHYRWLICALLCSATAINYVDRQIIGILKPTLQLQFGWSESAFADIIFWFQAAYALGYIALGSLIDRIGARLGYAAVVALWTAAHVAQAFVGTLTGFVAARFALGFGESGNFPAGLKAIAEWFPKAERALATGIFTAGSNIGAIITPLIVPFITLTWGWRASFIFTGLLSLVWLVVWLAVYRRPHLHRHVTTAELAHITSDIAPRGDASAVNRPAAVATGGTGERNVAWRRLLLIRETWAYALPRFLIDPIWWMFLFWLPDFFARRHHLDLQHFGPPLVVVYAMSDAGGVVGGWLSSKFIRLGMTVNRARKFTMLIASMAVTPIVFAMYADSLWLAVAIVGVATASHQAFSATLYTFPSDVFPRQMVGSIVGIGGTAGALGGMLMSRYAGWVLDSVGSYTPIFIVAGSVYILALAVLHVLSPRMYDVVLPKERA